MPRFGKPKLTSKQVRCLNCGEQYPEHRAELEHAGRIESGEQAGDYWNTKCPECGVFDMMGEEYAEMSDEEFQEEQAKIEQRRQNAAGA